MITTEQRQFIADLIEKACESGARLHSACKLIGISCRTLQRWLLQHAPVLDTAVAQQHAAQQPQASDKAVSPSVACAPALTPIPSEPTCSPCQSPPYAQEQTQKKEQVQESVKTLRQEPTTAPSTSHHSTAVRQVRADRRQSALRKVVVPHNKLSPQEYARILELLNSQEFCNLPASQIVPRLADQGTYIASESTMQRVLRLQGQNTHRRSTRAPKKRHKPLALKATAVNQVYTWDITYLPTTVKGQFFYLYVFVDIFSRYIVGAQVFACESADLGAELLKDICLRHGVSTGQLHLHSDNGAPMKGRTMLAMMQELGVMASRSRPSVSNDNPYSESLFGTLKHRPLMPVQPFDSIEQARLWVRDLVDWYNQEHRHSAIKFVTPHQRHSGQDAVLLQKRAQVYDKARMLHPERWAGNVRNWQRVGEVHLNPDKPTSKEVSSAKS